MNISLFLGLLVSTIAGFMPGKFRISNLNLSPLFLGFGYGYEKIPYTGIHIRVIDLVIAFGYV